jgi:hypothetical protein
VWFEVLWVSYEVEDLYLELEHLTSQIHLQMVQQDPVQDQTDLETAIKLLVDLPQGPMDLEVFPMALEIAIKPLVNPINDPTALVVLAMVLAIKLLVDQTKGQTDLVVLPMALEIAIKLLVVDLMDLVVLPMVLAIKLLVDPIKDQTDMVVLLQVLEIAIKALVEDQTDQAIKDRTDLVVLLQVLEKPPADPIKDHVLDRYLSELKFRQELDHLSNHSHRLHCLYLCNILCNFLLSHALFDSITRGIEEPRSVVHRCVGAPTIT